MRDDLLNLISEIDDIKKYFHVIDSNGLPKTNAIYDIPEFSVWKQAIQFELQIIFDKTNDNFIWTTLTNLKQKFNGWKDEFQFNELSGSLQIIAKNIDKYYPINVITSKTIQKEENTMIERNTRIFISHSSKDEKYVSCLVRLLDNIGLREEHIFCSSIPGYGIKLGDDIYDHLKKEFQEHNLHVIFVLSDHYYDSAACLNEMGASWVLQKKYTSILLPDFEFKNIKGAINPYKIGLRLANDSLDVKEKLGHLKNEIINEFKLSSISDIRWEEMRDSFIKSISAIENH